MLCAGWCRDVCQSGSHRALELVHSIQDCMSDSNPEVAALGFDALAALCHDDAIDFYSAWKVVQRLYPTLPGFSNLLASKWVGLLAYGALDVAVVPDKAVAVVQLLWAATNHHSAQVSL